MLALHDRCRNQIAFVQTINLGIPFVRKPSLHLRQFHGMFLHDFGGNNALAACLILSLAGGKRDIEDQCDYRHSATACEPQERTPGAVFQVGRVNHGQLA